MSAFRCHWGQPLIIDKLLTVGPLDDYGQRMARKLRVEYEGAIYHVTVRGVERRRLFDEDVERERFVDRLGESVDEYDVRVYLFCLMTNHVHLLVETPRANLSAFMQKLQTAYTVYYNLRHRRAGHLMQGRFGAEPVQGDRYLLSLSRYIHLNPVYVGRIRKQPLKERRDSLRRYRWSSYRGYAGLDEPYEFVDEVPVLAIMGTPKKKRRLSYRRFVEAGIAKTDEELVELLKTSTWGVGDKEFQDQIRDLHAARARKARRQEDVSFRRVAALVSAPAILDAVAKEFNMERTTLQSRHYDCVARAVAAFLLGRYARVSQRDAAIILGMGTGSAVCRQLQRLRDRRATDPALDKHIHRLCLNLDHATSEK